ncbi:hypothetical protein [Mycobacteroides abscessus]|uniref:hypothetical protein n=1 Tax=Mycobacteroides abscessus TaxID=36809 RepID=UPI00092C859E|nr:hypothetical protein [Mycobacteroides abscessus]SIE60209.1 Uncharacterised protein [Mycobacteroides abscessus subsp. abscessus]SKV27998.1 Uncharacterised protein [Mycobacteroides abscessus subsp. abscessus]
MNWPAFALTLTGFATLVSWWAFQQSLRYSRAEIVWLVAVHVLVLADAALVGAVV